MPTKFIYMFVLYLMSLLSCKSQERIDLLNISFDQPKLLVEEKPLIDSFSMFKGATVFKYRDLDKFSFDGFELKKEEGFPPSDLSLHLNQSQDSLISVEMTVRDNKQSDLFFKYLESKYGKPITLNPEPITQFEDKPFGSATYLWKNILPNRSIFVGKVYHVENKTEWRYDLIVNYVQTNDSFKFNLYDYQVNTFELLMSSYNQNANFNPMGKFDYKQYIESLPDAKTPK